MLAGYPTAKKLESLRAFFPDQTPDLPGAHNHDQHKGRDVKDRSLSEEWSTWDEQWTRIVGPIIVDRSR